MNSTNNNNTINNEIRVLDNIIKIEDKIVLKYINSINDLLSDESLSSQELMVLLPEILGTINKTKSSSINFLEKIQLILLNNSIEDFEEAKNVSLDKERRNKISNVINLLIDEIDGSKIIESNNKIVEVEEIIKETE